MMPQYVSSDHYNNYQIVIKSQYIYHDHATDATICKVCGSRDPLRRAVVLSTSGIQEEGERGVTTIKFVMMTMTML